MHMAAYAAQQLLRRVRLEDALDKCLQGHQDEPELHQQEDAEPSRWKTILSRHEHSESCALAAAGIAHADDKHRMANLEHSQVPPQSVPKLV